MNVKTWLWLFRHVSSPMLLKSCNFFYWFIFITIFTSVILFSLMRVSFFRSSRCTAYMIIIEKKMLSVCTFIKASILIAFCMNRCTKWLKSNRTGSSSMSLRNFILWVYKFISIYICAGYILTISESTLWSQSAETSIKTAHHFRPYYCLVWGYR